MLQKKANRLANTRLLWCRCADWGVETGCIAPSMFLSAGSDHLCREAGIVAIQKIPPAMKRVGFVDYL